FQAEDGIRVDLVTGVQTCALPIFASLSPLGRSNLRLRAGADASGTCRESPDRLAINPDRDGRAHGVRGWCVSRLRCADPERKPEIGRASCRERVESRGGAWVLVRR